jgi:hypothetical protein
MNLSQASNLPLSLGLGASGIADQLHDQPLEVEAMIEPIREGAEVRGGLLGLLRSLPAGS